jgi:hypothetical protein
MQVLGVIQAITKGKWKAFGLNIRRASEAVVLSCITLKQTPVK